jgi:hypothetical protein
VLLLPFCGCAEPLLFFFFFSCLVAIVRSEGGAECQRALELNGTLPDFSGGSSGGEGSGHGRTYSQESIPPLPGGVTKTEEGWPSLSVAL